MVDIEVLMVGMFAPQKLSAAMLPWDRSRRETDRDIPASKAHSISGKLLAV